MAETDLPDATFPAATFPAATFLAACPYTLDQIIDPDFWPAAPTGPVRPARRRRQAGPPATSLASARVSLAS